MTHWKEGDWDSVVGLTADFIPMCPFHTKTQMFVNDCKALNFSLRHDKNYDSCAVDVVMACPTCGYIDIYGVAISREHRLAIRDKLYTGNVNHETWKNKEIDPGAGMDKWLDIYR